MFEGFKPDIQKGFMAELDEWTAKEVIYPLFQAAMETDGNPKTEQPWIDACAQVGRAVRAKVLESYRNGQVARLTESARVPTLPGKGGTR